MDLHRPLRYLNPETPPHEKGRLAVIDIGSSSIRLVVYEDVRAYPYVVINQKVWCALAAGKGLENFRLAEDKITRALGALEWFLWVARQTGADAVLAFATSAVREAVNGPDFVARIKAELGLTVSILSGETESKLSAFGARFSVPDAKGLVVDLGGGSLELFGTETADFACLPLGVLTLKVLSSDTPQKACDILTKAFADVPWLAKAQGPSILAIGSGMRSIARLHMAKVDYPLNIVHDYRLPKADGLAFCEGLMTGDLSPKMADLSKNYRDVMPYRAAALYALLKLPTVREVRFATFGLREGVLFSQSGDVPILHDPLLAFAADLAERDGRGRAYADRLAAWVTPLVPNANRRYLQAAAYLAEISWREQVAYRARTAFDRVLGGSYVAADHALRARLALTCYFRHESTLLPGMETEVKGIVTPADIAEARRVGALFQLAELLDPGARGELMPFRLVRGADGVYRLDAPKAFQTMQSEEVAERLATVNQVFNA
jgi:exopolyphosphatase/guanosine-5'-triphosphate,3'-diphosphate pyrophosphatase